MSCRAQVRPTDLPRGAVYLGTTFGERLYAEGDPEGRLVLTTEDPEHGITQVLVLDHEILAHLLQFLAGLRGERRWAWPLL